MHSLFAQKCLNFLGPRPIKPEFRTLSAVCTCNVATSSSGSQTQPVISTRLQILNCSRTVNYTVNKTVGVRGNFLHVYSRTNCKQPIFVMRLILSGQRIPSSRSPIVTSIWERDRERVRQRSFPQWRDAFKCTKLCRDNCTQYRSGITTCRTERMNRFLFQNVSISSRSYIAKKPRDTKCYRNALYSICIIGLMITRIRDFRFLKPIYVLTMSFKVSYARNREQIYKYDIQGGIIFKLAF